MFFFLVCGCCIPLLSSSSRKWWGFQWQLPKGHKRCLCPLLWSIFWYCSCFVIHFACDPSLCLAQSVSELIQQPLPVLEVAGMSIGNKFWWLQLKLLLRHFWCIMLFSGRNRSVFWGHEQGTSCSKAHMRVCQFAGAHPKELQFWMIFSNIEDKFPSIQRKKRNSLHKYNGTRFVKEALHYRFLSSSPELDHCSAMGNHEGCMWFNGLSHLPVNLIHI